MTSRLLRIVVAAIALSMPLILSGCHWVVCGPPGTELRKESPCARF